MFLKRVEISGFKSFAKKTTLELLPACSWGIKSCGITVIVGPNGSGKSNIADAIRWVMGEQSMKSLRGKKSEDVIFLGSGQKARLGSAQVTLYFDNSDKKIPLEFETVSISRRIFRSGESEYFINGSRVRLIDVVDLLAKAGIGKESYCVINQGMSDTILSVNPLERRRVIEDAAGVKPFQIKKERAIRKLETTQINLQRVKDLIEEITPHLRSLKRQIEKAARGQEIRKELEKKQIELYSSSWNSFQKEKEILQTQRSEWSIKTANLQRELDKIQDELIQNEKSESQEEFREIEKKINETRKHLNQLEKDLVISEGRLEIEKEKKIEKEIIEKIPVDSLFVKTELDKIRSDQKKLIERLEKVESLAELQELKELARVIQQELFELQQKVSRGSVERKRDFSAEVQENEEKIKNLTQRCVQLRKDIELLKKKEDNLNQSLEELLARQRQERERFFKLEKLLRVKQEDLDKTKETLGEIKIKLAKVEVREEDLALEVKSELKRQPQELPVIEKSLDSEEELIRQINRLKVKLEQVGSIDPLVLEEYEETRKRHEFLTGELEDLRKAVKSCREVIKEMNTKIKEAFEQAFEQINKEFGKYFRIMFGGGSARLIKQKIGNVKADLSQSDNNSDLEQKGEQVDAEEFLEDFSIKNEEEIGIDIFACPPGKRISHLSMLSGGERSLTSIALLFAIISHNPPPFAVLDEVEAALDEANSRRFGKILQELSADTQFVIITHNRETMRQASLLYGVTMGEDGISKLLSVRMDQVTEEQKIGS